MLPTSDHDQPSFRRWATFADQHGRIWGATTENKTRAPCGPFEPQFTAPVYPPAEYITVDPSDDRKCFIDYERWLNNVREAREGYNREMRRWAVTLYGQGGLAQALAKPPAELLEIVGEPPRSKEEPVQAMLAGNPWILGFSGEMPEKAAAFFVKDPVSLQRQREVVYDPFAEDAPDPRFPKWNGGHKAWQLSDDTIIHRLEGEGKEEFRLRAETLQAQLEPLLLKETVS